MRVLFLFLDGGERQNQKRGIGPSTFAPSFLRRPRFSRAALYFFASY